MEELTIVEFGEHRTEKEYKYMIDSNGVPHKIDEETINKLWWQWINPPEKGCERADTKDFIVYKTSVGIKINV